jgi:aryl-alcohol dehydrogenase-like predicted oxidoreductase
MLSGKYANGAMPEGSRWSITNPAVLHRNTPQAHEAVAEYVKLAERFGYTPSQLALAWCDQVDGVTSTIIGATSMAQLLENIEAFEMPLSEELQTEVAAVFKRYPQPF